ncbi:MAG: hypothetical protein ACW99Q_22605 [Candidatus Kariarchaeaceae archaeon]|jgi:hypothetical protein
MDDIYVKRNGVTNHWGIWVDPEIPITGVVSNNSVVQFISDEMYNAINLDFDMHLESDDHVNEPEFCEICEYWEDYDSTYLIGDWILNTITHKWDYDPNGEYAAIVGEIYTQIVFSKYTRKSALCSPCYPGQADNDSEGDYLAYDLPPEAYEY